MNIKIREGTINEALEILNSIPELEKQSTESIALKIYDTDFYILIAELNRRNAGAMIICSNDIDTFEILTAGVLPEKRRKTLGALLLKRAINRARDNGAKKVVITCPPQYDIMRYLLVKSGFKPDKTDNVFYRNAAKL